MGVAHRTTAGGAPKTCQLFLTLLDISMRIPRWPSKNRHVPSGRRRLEFADVDPQGIWQLKVESLHFHRITLYLLNIRDRISAAPI
jgi:hypothetical protein